MRWDAISRRKGMRSCTALQVPLSLLNKGSQKPIDAVHNVMRWKAKELEARRANDEQQGKSCFQTNMGDAHEDLMLMIPS